MMDVFEFRKTLDELIDNNRDAGDSVYKVFNCGSDYWFIIKEELNHAVNPKEYVETDGKSGLDKYAGIVYELIKRENVCVWGLTINPETKDVEWVDAYKNPEKLIMDHYNKERTKFEFKEDEIVGERIILTDAIIPLETNKFAKVKEEFYDSIDRLLESYELIKVQLFNSTN